MMDCKKALVETEGDMEAAVDWLRTKGALKAAKKANRVAAEGLLGLAASGNAGTIVEVNSETDFVARNEEFQAIVRDIARLGLEAEGDIAKLSDTKMANGQSVTEALKALVGRIGENMTLRRTTYLSVTEGVLASYLHNAIGEGLGKIAVLLALESKADKEKLAEFGRQLCMHIAALSPLTISTDGINPDVLAREKAVYMETAKESGKPEHIAEKMVQGQLNKFMKESALLTQSFVINPDLTIEKAIAEAEKELGSPIKITAFKRFALGEGVEKKECDFAAEVAAAASGA
jgi:elongation factor Ts